MSGRIHLGTSGYVYKDWKEIFYSGVRAKDWLGRYCAAFDTLELNATFYRLPFPESVDRWRDASPPGFAYAAKGSRFLTHMKRLKDAGPGLQKYYDRVLRLGSKLAVVLWQLPPQMNKPDLERLDVFLRNQPKGPRQAVEFRDEAWYTEEVCRLLDRHGAAFCEHDLVKREIPRPTGGFRYIRFHGPGKVKYHDRYGAERLVSHAEDLAQWRDGGGDAYVFFNNDWHGAALYDVRELSRLLGCPLDFRMPEDEKEVSHERRRPVGPVRDRPAHDHPAL